MNTKNTNNKLFNRLFIPYNKSRKLSAFLIILLSIIAIISCIFSDPNNQIFNYNFLQKLSEFTLTTVLTMVAIGICIFQSDEKLTGQNNKNNKSEMFIRYIFSMFPVILITMMGFFVSPLLYNHGILIRLYSLSTFEVLLLSVSETIKYFVYLFDITD